MKSRKWTSVVVMTFAALATITTPTTANAQQGPNRRNASPAWVDGKLAAPPFRSLAQTPSRYEDSKTHDVRYNVVPIGVLPGKTNTDLAEGKTLNNLGHIAGISYAYTGGPNDVFLTSQAFIWSNGRMHALPLLAGWPGAFSFGLNDRDQVVGVANKIDGSGNFVQTAVLWDHAQVISLGSLQPNTNSYPYDINIWGVVVGGSQIPGTGSNTPVVWYGGAIHALPFLPGMNHGFAESINDLGMIAGRQGLPDGSSQVPCLWYWNGSGYTPVSLGSLGGDYGDALGINDFGQIVGWSLYTGDIHGPAFVWDAVHGLHALPSLPGDTDGSGNDINDLGQIVGFSQLFDDNGNLISQRVVLWRNSIVTELQTLVPPGTPTLTDVGHANLLGQIDVDTGSVPDGTLAGYLLVPTH